MRPLPDCSRCAGATPNTLLSQPTDKKNIYNIYRNSDTSLFLLESNRNSGNTLNKAQVVEKS